MYLRQRCFGGSVNKTILKPRVAAAAGRANTYMWDFSDVNSAYQRLYDIGESSPVPRHPNYYPDRAQKLIGSSMSRHLSTRNVSSKSMHAFLSNLANRQTDRQTDRHTDRQTVKHWQKHLLPPLSEVTKRISRASVPIIIL